MTVLDSKGAPMSIEDFVKNLHDTCVYITSRRPDGDTDVALEYLRMVARGEMCRPGEHLTDEQVAIAERMAARIKAEGLDMTAGAYRDL